MHDLLIRNQLVFVSTFGITQIPYNLPELLQCSFEIFHDLQGDNVGIGEVIRCFEGFVLEPEYVEAGFIAAHEFVIVV